MYSDEGESTLRQAIDAVQNRGYDSSFAYYEKNFYLWKNNEPKYGLKDLHNSFKLPKIGIEGMGMYVAKKVSLCRDKVRICGEYTPTYINAFEAIDIDYPDDLEFARTIAQGFDSESEYIEGINKYRI